MVSCFTPSLRAPFPAFGGKSAVAPVVWQRFGRVENYVEPFVFSGAVALAAPAIPPYETWNDLNGQVANFWRATSADPDTVAAAADWPVSEVDLHARHAWLVRHQDGMTERLMGDPTYYDATIAGWWLWGICQWIGGGWCSGQGPWTVNGEGRLVDARNRQLPHLGGGRGGCAVWTEHLHGMMRDLRDRIRRVRVCCGDWTRVCGPTPTSRLGLTGVFLDPPYQVDGRDNVYGDYDAHPDGANTEVFYRVVEWARAHEADPSMRIAVCGYDENGLFPETWERYRWKARGGYGSQGQGRGRDNAHRETIWFSPQCVQPVVTPDLFSLLSEEGG